MISKWLICYTLVLLLITLPDEGVVRRTISEPYTCAIDQQKDSTHQNAQSLLTVQIISGNMFKGFSIKEIWVNSFFFRLCITVESTYVTCRPAMLKSYLSNPCFEVIIRLLLTAEAELSQAQLGCSQVYPV